MRFLKKIYYYFRRHQPQTFKPLVLVTGCGSGIGLALAKKLYRQNTYRAVITARSKTLERLKKEFTENEDFILRPLDITNEQERDLLIEEVNQKWGGVNILVNNAGISYRAVVEHMTEADEIKQMTTNYLGPMALIRAVIPNMREQGRGKIINVSSVSGMLAMPTMASYSASKYALEGASEALWYEMKPLGIDVVLVQPGFIHSHSFEKVYYTERSSPEICEIGPYCDYYYYMTPFVGKMMKRSITTPEKVAKTIFKVIRTEDPPLWIPATPDAVVFYYIRRLMPRRWLLPFLFWCLPHAKKWGQAYTRKRIS